MVCASCYNILFSPLNYSSWIGITIPDLYKYEDHGIAMDEITASVKELLQSCRPEQVSQLQFPLDARQWRSWSNPEIYMSKYGLRLDEISEDLTKLILEVLRKTLSPEGFIKARSAMRVNDFLGQLVKGPRVLNEFSYNFLLFGQPSTNEAWGWSIYGHHLCINVFLYKSQITISPVFIGAEPNEIDDGPYKGSTMMRREEQWGLRLMQTLPESLRKEALVYSQLHDPNMPPGRWNEADQRHLCGAFQDNRIVPYEGICASKLESSHVELLFQIIEEFVIYLPKDSRQQRLNQIRKHLDTTYFSWIGGFGIEDAFYYRIQSPVIVLEFDHHSGVFLVNESPAKYHIHTIARMPNQGDYGNALRRPSLRLK